MAESKWVDSLKKIAPFVILIETPSGRGTGSIIHPPPGSENYCVATALHVIQHAFEWHEPIKFTHYPSKKYIFLDNMSRKITMAPEHDQAIIQFKSDEINITEAFPPLLQEGSRLLEGVEVGWIGYPAVAPNKLCFFHGYVSTWLDTEEAYLVDGIAINGVSGGPAFVQSDESTDPIIIGLVTEYRPNLATGVVLPGVSLIRGINPLSRLYASIEKQLEVAKVQEIPKDFINQGNTNKS